MNMFVSLRLQEERMKMLLDRGEMAALLWKAPELNKAVIDPKDKRCFELCTIVEEAYVALDKLDSLGTQPEAEMLLKKEFLEKKTAASRELSIVFGWSITKIKNKGEDAARAARHRSIMEEEE